MKLKKKFFEIFAYLISAVFLYLTFRHTDFRLIADNFKYVNPFLLILSLLLNFCFFLFRAKYQNNNLHYIKPNINFTVSITSIGLAQFYNSIFPARLGEVIRACFLNKKENIGTVTVLSYIFVEKVMDFIFILILFLILIISGIHNIETNKMLYISLIIIVFVISGLIVYIKFNAFVFGLVKYFMPSNIYKIFQNLNEQVLIGLKFFKSLKQILVSAFFLIIGWSCIAGIYWCISFPYVQLLDLPYYSCLFFMLFSAFALALPSAPAGVGVVHYGIFLAVQLLMKGDIESQMNLIGAFIIVLHFFTVLMDLFIGGLVICYYRIKFNDKLEYTKM